MAESLEAIAQHIHANGPVLTFGELARAWGRERRHMIEFLESSFRTADVLGHLGAAHPRWDSLSGHEKRQAFLGHVLAKYGEGSNARDTEQGSIPCGIGDQG